MDEPVYEVVWPLGKSLYDTFSLAERSTDLSGKTFCEFWDWVFRGETIFPILRELLAKRYPSVKFVEYTEFGNSHGPNEKETMAGLPQFLKEHGCDAAICGVGA